MVNNRNKSSGRMIMSLTEIYADIIAEVLNFDNVSTYPVERTSEGWKFLANIGYEEVDIWVYIEPSKTQDFKMDYRFPVDSQIVNFGFEIGDQRTTNQYQKTNFKDYIRILATAGKILKTFLLNNKPDIITFFSDSKQSGHNPDPQKDNIYFAALEKNIPPGFNIGDIYYIPTKKKGIALYKSSN